EGKMQQRVSAKFNSRTVFSRATMAGVGLAVGLVLAGCGKKDEVLARYQGGEIRRGEFSHLFAMLLNARRGIPDVHKGHKEPGSVAEQTKALEQLLDIRLGAESARKAGLDKRAEFQTAAKMLELRAVVETLGQRSLKFYR